MVGENWLVRMEWRPAGWSVCLPLLIFPCTTKSKRSLLAPAHLIVVVMVLCISFNALTLLVDCQKGLPTCKNKPKLLSWEQMEEENHGCEIFAPSVTVGSYCFHCLLMYRCIFSVFFTLRKCFECTSGIFGVVWLFLLL